MVDRGSRQFDEGDGPRAAGRSASAQRGLVATADRTGFGQHPAPSRRRRRPIPPKYYRISDLVEYSGVSRQTIHNYTTMGLLRESCWTRGGHRLYSESAFERLDIIDQLKAERRPMEFIRAYCAKLDARQRRDTAADGAGNGLR